MQLSKWNPFKFMRNKDKGKNGENARKPENASQAAPAQAIMPLQPSAWMKSFFQSPAWIDPWRTDFWAAFHDMDRWFGDFSAPAFRPTVDVIDEGKMLRVTCELPGLEDKDVKVAVADGALTISGEKKVESKTENEGCYRLERSYGAFKRVLPLPRDVTHDGIEAEMSKGVLTVRIPKAEQTRSTEKSIPIQAS